MTDEQLRQQEQARASQAEQVLKNPLVMEVLDRLEKDIINTWEVTPMRDMEAREKAWLWFVTVRKFRNTFLGFIETGKLASVQLEEKRRFKLFGGR